MQKTNRKNQANKAKMKQSNPIPEDELYFGITATMKHRIKMVHRRLLDIKNDDREKPVTFDLFTKEMPHSVFRNLDKEVRRIEGELKASQDGDYYPRGLAGVKVLQVQNLCSYLSSAYRSSFNNSNDD